jgi:hypothetical protein
MQRGNMNVNFRDEFGSRNSVLEPSDVADKTEVLLNSVVMTASRHRASLKVVMLFFSHTMKKFQHHFHQCPSQTDINH